jgi:hypothetical protein
MDCMQGSYQFIPSLLIILIALFRGRGKPLGINPVCGSTGGKYHKTFLKSTISRTAGGVMPKNKTQLKKRMPNN